PAVQPLGGSDLLTLGAHSGSHVTDITREGIFTAVAKHMRRLRSRSARPRCRNGLSGGEHRRRSGDPYFCMYRVLSSLIVSLRAWSTCAIKSTACLRLRLFAE